MNKHRIPVLFSEDEIAERIEELAEEIAKEMPQDIMIVSLLRGSFVFTADLIRALYKIGLSPQIDFMTLTSYVGTASSREVLINRDISESVKGRAVLVLDDILETGRTLDFAMKLLRDRGAEMLKIAVLLEKPGKLESEIRADFIGFHVPDKFVIGYGLDYDNHYRELPYIGYMEIH